MPMQVVTSSGEICKIAQYLLKREKMKKVTMPNLLDHPPLPHFENVSYIEFVSLHFLVKDWVLTTRP